MSRGGQARHEHVFELTGGALCLDFVNTLGDRPRSAEEHLHEYGDLLAWGRQAGVLGASEAARLEHQATRQPARTRRALRRALALRESLYRIFSSQAAGGSPDPADIEALNGHLEDAMARLRVVRTRDGFDWSWPSETDSLERVLWPVARSAAELLTCGERCYVRECSSETCSWLFVDRSRTRRRRWCDMKTCGNRDKARRHYARKKNEAKAGARGG